MNAKRLVDHLRRYSKQRLLAGMLALCTTSIAPGDILIDDFTTGGPFNKTLVPGSGRIISLSETGLDPGHTIGGSRDLWFDSCLTFGTMPVEHDPEDGIWAFGGTQYSRFCEGPTFQYGRVYSSSNPLDINLETNGVTGVEVTIDSLTPGLPNPWNDPLSTPPSVSVEFFTHNEESNTSVMSAPLTATTHPMSVYLPISSLSPGQGGEGASLTDIDGIVIWFGGFGDASQLNHPRVFIRHRI